MGWWHCPHLKLREKKQYRIQTKNRHKKQATGEKDHQRIASWQPVEKLDGDSSVIRVVT